VLLGYKPLLFSTKHRFLEKNLVSALFTRNPKVSFKSKNVKLFKEIDKKFYLKLIKLFSYRRYAADPSSCFYGRWLSPSVKELSPQSGLLSKALRSSDSCHYKPRKRRQLLSVGHHPTNVYNARTHAKHERIQRTNACKARTHTKHERMQSTNACKARTHAKHERIQSTHVCKARTHAKHERIQSTNACKARTHAKHERMQSTNACKARTNAKHERMQSTNACKARTYAKHERMQSTNANTKHERIQSTQSTQSMQSTHAHPLNPKSNQTNTPLHTPHNWTVESPNTPL
jgi:hypothetical protein